MSKGRGLNLDVLDDIDNIMVSQGNAYRELSLDLLSEDPNQPRDTFDDDAIRDMADTVKMRGIVTPISVRDDPDHPGRYIINHGARRFRAARLAGLLVIPAVLNNGATVLDQMIENIHRKGFEPMEVAKYIYARRQERAKVKNKDIARELGVSESFISNHAAFLELSDLLRAAYTEGRVTDIVAVNILHRLEKVYPEVVAEALAGHEEVTRSIAKGLEREYGKSPRGGGEVRSEVEERGGKKEGGKASGGEGKGKRARVVFYVQYGTETARLLTRGSEREGMAWIGLEGKELEVPIRRIRLLRVSEE